MKLLFILGATSTALGNTIVTLVSFLLLFWLVKRVAWKPLMGMLEERERVINADLDKAAKNHEISQQQRSETEKTEKKTPTLPEPKEVLNQGKPTHGIYVEGGAGMLVRFAHCCNPVPGDEIVGYITRGRGVTVHKSDCVNAMNSEPERAIRVSWAEEGTGTFNAAVRIVAYDHPSLLGEITVFVSDMGAPVSAVSMKANKNGTVTIHLVLQVGSKDQLRQALNRIQKRSDVLEAYRSVS